MTAGNENGFVTVHVSVRVPVFGCNVNVLEAECGRAAREAMSGAMKMIQLTGQSLLADRLERRQWRERRLFTCFGLIRVAVLQVRDRQTRRCFSLLNELTGLEPRRNCTPRLEQMALRARVRGLSYRQSSRLMQEHFGAALSHMHVWRRVQVRGAECERREKELTEAVFRGDGQLMTLPSEPPGHLYLEADELHVKAQRSQTETIRIKTGVSYTGRRPAAGAARYSLIDKRVYVGVEGAGEFGYNWTATLQNRYRVWDAEAVLYLSDGDRWLRGLPELHFPQAIRQMDWAHVLRDVTSEAPDEKTRKRWTKAIARGRHRELQPELTELLRTASQSSEPLLRLSRRLAENGDDLQGWRRFRNFYDPERLERIPRATGAVEKNQETVLARAMKGRGMAWKARSANHLAKLIKASLYPEEWKLVVPEPCPPLT